MFNNNPICLTIPKGQSEMYIEEGHTMQWSKGKGQKLHRKLNTNPIKKKKKKKKNQQKTGGNTREKGGEYFQ